MKCVALMMFALLFLGLPRQALAAGSVSCTAAGPTINFGTISPYTGYPYSGSGNIAVTCTNTTASTATVSGCFSIGTGSGGTSPANRTMASGSNTIGIQISQGGPQIGDGTAYPMAGPYSLSVPVNNTTPSNFPIVVTVPTPGTAPPPGNYTTTFSGTDSQIIYIVGSAPPTCAAVVSSGASSNSASFTVKGTVPTQCKVAATNLAFPTRSVLSSAATASATVTTTCNASVPVTIALDNGANGTGPAARHMRSGSNAILYGIYQDAALTLPWGQTSGSNTASLPNGSGAMTAYGQVPAQNSPAPGSYSDVVGVTITY